jgi:hypothetical protein
MTRYFEIHAPPVTDDAATAPMRVAGHAGRTARRLAGFTPSVPANAPIISDHRRGRHSSPADFHAAGARIPSTRMP